MSNKSLSFPELSKLRTRIADLEDTNRCLTDEKDMAHEVTRWAYCMYVWVTLVWLSVFSLGSCRVHAATETDGDREAVCASDGP